MKNVDMNMMMMAMQKNELNLAGKVVGDDDGDDGGNLTGKVVGEPNCEKVPLSDYRRSYRWDWGESPSLQCCLC